VGTHGASPHHPPSRLPAVGGARGRRVPLLPPDEEDEDDENYHIITEAAMEDVPLSAGDLPP
jgi:hypothetical protein